jgi:hypothetical protein
MLAEPSRTRSLDLLKRYADFAVDLANQVPDNDRFGEDVARIGDVQRELWSVAGDAVRADPDGTAPLNAMIDSHTDRVTSLRNRVPSTVLILQVFGSAIAVGVLSLYLALLGRGLIASLVATTVVILILFISFDLDRPHRGLITVPDGALVAAREAMNQPPAATGP